MLLRLLPALVILLVNTTVLADELSDALESQGGREVLIGSYEKHPDKWTAADLLPIAISYALEKKLDKAEAAYQKFLSAEPDNIRGIRGLGNVYLIQGKEYEKAIAQFKRARELGDLDSLQPLTVAYLVTQQYEKIKPLVPDLMKLRLKDLRVVNALAAYSFSATPPDKEVFFKATRGISDDELVKDANAAQTVIKGCEFFGDVARAQALKAKLPKTL